MTAKTSPTHVQRQQWLNAVEEAVSNRRLSEFDFRLAWRLASAYVNGVSGDAWPSQQTVAAQMGVGVRSVRAGIQRLRKEGLLIVERRAHDSNCMRLNLEQAIAQPSRTKSNRQESAGHSDEVTGKNLPVTENRLMENPRFREWVTGRKLPL